MFTKIAVTTALLKSQSLKLLSSEHDNINHSSYEILHYLTQFVCPKNNFLSFLSIPKYL
jgi:hypothetical protein